MATFEITGHLKVKNDTVHVSDKFAKREFVVTIDATTPYPQHISLQFTQGDCDRLDSINVGDEVKVSFNLRGNEYNSPTKGLQYFNNLQAWKIERLSSAPPQQASAPVDTLPSQEVADDLPF